MTPSESLCQNFEVVGGIDIGAGAAVRFVQGVIHTPKSAFPEHKVHWVKEPSAETLEAGREMLVRMALESIEAKSKPAGGDAKCSPGNETTRKESGTRKRPRRTEGK